VFKIRRAREPWTKGVPVAIEINLRPGGTLDGCEVIDAGVVLLSNGYAIYSAANQKIRFGPGLCQHGYTQIRGAMPKMPGRSVYLTGFTPP
jgi:hypothetical protein